MIYQQIAFSFLLAASAYLFYKNIKKLSRNISLGKPMQATDRIRERWRLVLLNALGQKKMFKKPIPAVLHFFVYAGFIIINIEILEIILDGISGEHRLFAGFMGSLYPVLISSFEFLGILVLVSCAILLFRRNVLKVKRLNMEELNNFPRMDANIILITEILLMSAFLLLDTADLNLQGHHPHYPVTGDFYFSGMLKPALAGMSVPQLLLLERIGWWFHIIGVCAFLNYLPYSKHLHIILSFPNTFYAKLDSKGKMQNMPEITREVQLMLNPDLAATAPAAEPGKFGAKDVTDLSRRDLLAAYSCTECGRCTDACPANTTGKKLSPRRIMMATRDRSEEIGKNLDAGKDINDGKALLGGYITHEEILACTTCQACTEACPVNIDPLAIIIQLRRYMIMEEANSPAPWNVMFGNVENNQAPWQFSPQDRFKWSEEV